MAAQQPPQVMKWLTIAPMFCLSTHAVEFFEQDTASWMKNRE